MLFSSAFFAAASMLLSRVTALPQPEDSALSGRATSAPCAGGSFRFNSTTCAPCPPGSYCTGTSQPQRCDSGTYQPNANSTSCIATTPGHYQSAKGSTSQVPCPAGTYQPYNRQAFCYGAPSGRFQNMTGQATVCGTCCGWAAPLQNNNVNPVNCTGSKPNSYPSSGDGCISKNTGCVHAQTCVQSANGSCPAQTFSG
ncbi:hypothetical protein B0H11DRAFT_2280473 [Mycena galericulata]|nr:hypothetical protein B0H11DRAFT_2280473 [Mycena galericulata]